MRIENIIDGRRIITGLKEHPMTTIIIPGDHLLIAGMNIIPEIEGQLGRNWDQPPRNNIQIEIKPDPDSPIGGGEPLKGVPAKYDLVHAYMSAADMKRLPEYSRSQPTGVYPGKMWKGEYTPFQEEDPRWYLLWYSEVLGDMTKCKVNSCPILLTDLLDLLNPAGAATGTATIK